MAFSEAFLDELRAALPVSQVVGRKLKLKKEGQEFRAIEDPSITVNDGKQLWWDHAKTKGGDIFKWLQEQEGFAFPDAVEECAKLAGVALPADGRRPRAGSKASAGGDPRGDDEVPPAEPDDYGVGRPDTGGGKARGDNVTAAYDYTDPQGTLIYQVCRVEWDEDGKKKKTFMQRRPGPDGSWIWGLSPGEFLKGRNGDWYAATEQRMKKWKGAESRFFSDGAEHSLYRLVELREEASPDDPVFIVEGEKDVETLRGWEFTATTNSGGTKKWRDEFAEYFRDRHVVICVDNDEPGRAGGEQIARSLNSVAKSIRVLDFAAVWPDAPKGADVTDWKLKAGGKPAQLLDMVEKAPPWRPTIAGRFKLIAFAAVELSRRTRYLVRGLVPRSGLIIVWGPPKCGKSFWVFDLLMHVALGWLYRGRHTEQGPIIYLTLEGHEDFNDRIEAFRQRRLTTHKGVVPFYLLATRLDLVAEHQQLIADLKAQMAGVMPAAIAIDTLNRSLRGSESSDEDMAAYVNAATALIEAFQCAVIVIHHCGLEATRPRGHTSLTGAADAQLKCTRAGTNTGNVIVEVEWMKGGAAGDSVLSRLESVQVGVDEYNFPITSCVIDPVEDVGKAVGAAKLTAQQRNFVDALIEAIDGKGVPPPPSLQLPTSIKRVVDYTHVKAVFAKKELNDGEEPADHKDRLRQALRRTRQDLQGRNIIAVADPYMWLTGRPIDGMARTSAPPQDNGPPLPDDAGDMLA